MIDPQDQLDDIQTTQNNLNSVNQSQHGTLAPGSSIGGAPKPRLKKWHALLGIGVVVLLGIGIIYTSRASDSLPTQDKNTLFELQVGQTRFSSFAIAHAASQDVYTVPNAEQQILVLIGGDNKITCADKNIAKQLTNKQLDSLADAENRTQVTGTVPRNKVVELVDLAKKTINYQPISKANKPLDKSGKLNIDTTMYVNEKAVLYEYGYKGAKSTIDDKSVEILKKVDELCSSYVVADLPTERYRVSEYTGSEEATIKLTTAINTAGLERIKQDYVVPKDSEQGKSLEQQIPDGVKQVLVLDTTNKRYLFFRDTKPVPRENLEIKQGLLKEEQESQKQSWVDRLNPLVRKTAKAAPDLTIKRTTRWYYIRPSDSRRPIQSNRALAVGKSAQQWYANSLGGLTFPDQDGITVETINKTNAQMNTCPPDANCIYNGRLDIARAQFENIKRHFWPSGDIHNEVPINYMVFYDGDVAGSNLCGWSDFGSVVNSQDDQLPFTTLSMVFNNMSWERHFCGGAEARGKLAQQGLSESQVDDAGLAQVVAHEIGHNLNMAHTHRSELGSGSYTDLMSYDGDCAITSHLRDSNCYLNSNQVAFLKNYSSRMASKTLSIDLSSLTQAANIGDWSKMFSGYVGAIAVGGEPVTGKPLVPNVEVTIDTTCKGIAPPGTYCVDVSSWKFRAINTDGTTNNDQRTGIWQNYANTLMCGVRSTPNKPYIADVVYYPVICPQQLIEIPPNASPYSTRSLVLPNYGQFAPYDPLIASSNAPSGKQCDIVILFKGTPQQADTCHLSPGADLVVLSNYLLAWHSPSDQKVVCIAGTTTKQPSPPITMYTTSNSGNRISQTLTWGTEGLGKLVACTPNNLTARPLLDQMQYIQFYAPADSELNISKVSVTGVTIPK